MRIRICPLVVLTFLLLPEFAFSQVTPKLLLGDYNPRQRGANVETPKAGEVAKCTHKVVKQAGGGSGYVVYGPQGQVLRRFIDTDNDGKVDQFRYYNLGVEVYRDIDSDGDEKIDQFRWLNTGGTRWGIDNDGDNRVDEWKRISAQEAAQVAVTAMIAGDTATVRTVFLTAADVRTLGLKGSYAERAQASVANVAGKVKQATAGSKVFTGSKWMRFDAQAPGLIPSGKVASRDLVVYENAMAMVESAGKPALIHVGELVKVGEAWKLVTVPQSPVDGKVPSVSVLMAPELLNANPDMAVAGGEMSKEVRDLLRKLTEIDKNAPSPSAGRAAISRYNRERAKTLAQLAAKAKAQTQRDEFTKQFADGVAAAVQGRDGWVEGRELLSDLEKEIGKDSKRSKSDVYPYVVYRRMLADYAARLLEAAENVAARGEVQDWWLDQLPGFVKKFPNAPDAADAMIEIAKNEEFGGKLDEAEKAYREVARRHPKLDAGRLGAGALRRLGLEGRKLSLSGTAISGRKVGIQDYKGKVVLVLFWSTWCGPCKQEVPQLVQLHAKYKRNGFEVLGVNLDDPQANVKGHLQSFKMTGWNHLMDPGGMQKGKLAQEFGIISLPTMFLVDRDGKVISRSVSLGDLQKGLPNVLSGKPLKQVAAGANKQPPANRNTRERRRNRNN